jgi:hypothetical protein
LRSISSAIRASIVCPAMMRHGVHPDVPEAGPTSRGARGRAFALLTLLVTVVAAAVVGITTYLTLDAVDLVSANPVGAAAWWFSLLLAGSAGALLAFLAATVALFYCRPKGTAVLAALLSVVLPAGAFVLAAVLGLQALQQNKTDDLAQDAPAVAALVIDVLDAMEADPGRCGGSSNAWPRPAEGTRRRGDPARRAPSPTSGSWPHRVRADAGRSVPGAWDAGTATVPGVPDSWRLP